MSELAEIFAREFPVWHMVVRGTLVYWLAKFLEPQPEVLIRHGRVVRKAMKREMITMDELESKLREAGVEQLSDVRIARLEGDGKLSVFKVASAKDPTAPQDRGPVN